MGTNIRGIHHLTTITSDSPKIWDFLTNKLGLHLIKKTVNQDDVRTYHLYFSDDQGEGGSVLTFFDFPGIQKAVFGTDEISRTSFCIGKNMLVLQLFEYKNIFFQFLTHI